MNFRGADLECAGQSQFMRKAAFLNTIEQEYRKVLMQGCIHWIIERHRNGTRKLTVHRPKDARFQIPPTILKRCIEVVKHDIVFVDQRPVFKIDEVLKSTDFSRDFSRSTLQLVN
jgi:hypothetical protein